MQSRDVIEKGDSNHEDPSDLKVIPPWNSHVDPDIPLPEKIEETLVSRPKKPRLHRKKMIKKYVGLPAPLITRAKSRMNDISISSLNYSDLLNRQQPSEQLEFDVDIYDQFFDQRYLR